MYKIIFFGTSELAVPSLKALMQDGRFEIAGVVTQPDRPVGRHATITPPPVKQFLIEKNTIIRHPEITEASYANTTVIFQPEKLSDPTFQSWLKEVGPTCDAFVIVSYGKILPQWVLDLPKQGIINLHPSLLPLHRGPTPIQAAIAAGDRVTGVSIMKIDTGMDHGPILAWSNELIEPTDTGTTLHGRLAEIGASLLVPTLDAYLNGDIEPTEQDHAKASFCGILSRENGKIDWDKRAEEIERLVRAYDPWPGTWTEVEGKRVKIFSTRIRESSIPSLLATQPQRAVTPGTRYVLDGLPCIMCGDKASLIITELQVEGKERVKGEEFVRGKQKWGN